MEGLEQFRWYRGTDALDWRESRTAVEDGEGHSGTRRYLMSPDGERGQAYDPLSEERGLFLNFADLETDEEQVLDFARRYGFLGVADTQPVWTGLREPPTDVLWGERFDKWADALIIMRVAVTLAQSFGIGGKPDIERARGLVTHTLLGDNLIRVRVDLKGLHGFEDIPLSMNPDGSEWSRATVVPRPLVMDKAAAYAFTRAALVDIVNANLRALCNPQLALSGGIALVAIQPKNLLGAMWLQLAHALDGDRKYRRCEECGGWFEVGSDGKRPDSKTCSGRCRTRKHRRENPPQTGGSSNG